MSNDALDNRSKVLRALMLHAMAHARRGHIGSACSIMEILRVLYDDVLRIDPARPDDPNRDRFLLSKGHGALALYALLVDRGFIPRAELERFCAFDGLLGGHPDACIPGVEAGTGSLGHGLPLGIGMALAGRIDRRPFRTVVLLGDGECNEGSIWEAALAAAKHHLDTLTVIVDYNKMQSFGTTSEVQELEPFADKWRAFGFAVAEAPGHDVAALRKTLTHTPFRTGQPSALICHTTKGHGFASVVNSVEWHHKVKITDAELATLHRELGVAE